VDPDPHPDPDIHVSVSFGNLDPHPDPHQSNKLDSESGPDPNKFADEKLKCMEYGLI
jgi:hypothetical protein